jgi:hypothetical protein
LGASPAADRTRSAAAAFASDAARRANHRPRALPPSPNLLGRKPAASSAIPTPLPVVALDCLGSYGGTVSRAFAQRAEAAAAIRASVKKPSKATAAAIGRRPWSGCQKRFELSRQASARERPMSRSWWSSNAARARRLRLRSSHDETTTAAAVTPAHQRAERNSRHSMVRRMAQVGNGSLLDIRLPFGPMGFDSRRRGRRYRASVSRPFDPTVKVCRARRVGVKSMSIRRRTVRAETRMLWRTPPACRCVLCRVAHSAPLQHYTHDITPATRPARCIRTAARPGSRGPR